MGKLVDLTGKRFGRLIVIERYGTNNCGKSTWLCECECGNKVVVSYPELNNGHTKSCGCLRKESESKANFCDLVGKRFGRLVVIERAGSSNSQKALWKCQCDCGNISYVITGSLKNGQTQSCGCYGNENRIKANITHGGNRERLYRIWCSMKSRCYNKNTSEYEYYGGRGICICDEWKNDYSKFREWAYKNGYKNNLSIDRIDVNRNYCPENCRWATAQIQANNMRRNIYITINGEKRTLTEWSRLKGVSSKTVWYRFKNGVGIDHLFDKPNSMPHKTKINITYNEETHSISEWAEITGINEKTLRGRYWRGVSIDHLFDLPRKGNK